MQKVNVRSGLSNKARNCFSGKNNHPHQRVRWCEEGYKMVVCTLLAFKVAYNALVCKGKSVSSFS